MSEGETSATVRMKKERKKEEKHSENEEWKRGNYSQVRLKLTENEELNIKPTKNDIDQNRQWTKWALML